MEVYYESYDPTKYNEVFLYLAYIGLGADALMLTSATTIGTPLNAAVAAVKPAVKLIKGTPLHFVLAKKLPELADLAAKRDWTGFEAKANIMLPFLQLFAAVALDDDLRDLLGGAIRNVTDFKFLGHI